MTFEEWLSGVLKKKSINISSMARELGISYRLTYRSLSGKDGERELRSSELIAICRYTGVNPMDFPGIKEG